jgi:hypothetical protein
LHESLVSLYRVFCQPSSFREETAELRSWGRLGLMARLSPAVLLVSVLVSGSVYLGAQAMGLEVNWLPLGFLRSLESLGIGIVWAVVWSVPMGVVWAVVWGATHWVLEAIFVPHMPLVSGEIMRAIGLWAPLGLALGIGLGVSVARGWGVLWGVGVAWTTAILLSVPAGIAFLFPFVIGYFRLEWYVIDVGGTLALLVAARAHPREARNLFQSSPIYWREPIWLPLLGLKSFLRLVGEQDQRAGLEECLFVLLERRTQARMARSALLEMTARRLAAPRSVQEIAAAAESIAHMKADPVRLGGDRARVPALLARAVPALEELAQLAEQHLAATLRYNRVRALERLRDGAEDLARVLAVERAWLARMLAEVATGWAAVAAARLEEIGESQKAGGFIENPYVFGQPIEETETNLFVGRRDVVREIEVSLLRAAQKPALVLWGPRRMGKTSVLVQLPRLLGPEFAPAFLDMQAMQARESVEAFFASVTEAAAAGLRRRGMEVEALGESELASSPFSVFARWTKEVERKLGSDHYLLLCLDEFERLEGSIREGKLPVELMDQIRHIIQHHAQIVLLFAGSHRPDEMELNWPDALISTRLVRVSYLKEDEARQLIVEPVPEFGVSFGPGSVERIVEVTRCQPNLVQAVCYELVNHLNLAERREARQEDVDVAVREAFESAHLYFAEMWSQLEESQRRLAAAIAGSEGRATAEALAEAVGTAAEDALRDLRALEAQSIVELADNRWRFQVPMVGQWVRNRAAGMSRRPE